MGTWYSNGSKVANMLSIALALSQVLVAAAWGVGRPYRGDVLPTSPIRITRPFNGDMMEEGVPTVSIDEVCSRALDQPWYCNDQSARLPIDTTCDGLIHITGYVPKGCDGAYMIPADRTVLCDDLEMAGQPLPHFCFDLMPRRGVLGRGGRKRGMMAHHPPPPMMGQYGAGTTTTPKPFFSPWGGR